METKVKFSGGRRLCCDEITLAEYKVPTKDTLVTHLPHLDSEENV